MAQPLMLSQGQRPSVRVRAGSRNRHRHKNWHATGDVPRPWSLGCSKTYLALKARGEGGAYPEAALPGHGLVDQPAYVTSTAPVAAGVLRRLQPAREQLVQSAAAELIRAIQHRQHGGQAVPPSGGPGSAAPLGVARDPARHSREQQQLLSAAAIFPALAWRWVSVEEAEDCLESGTLGLVKEALIVLRAAQEASTATASNLVEWCLQSCSTASAGLAALWGWLQAGGAHSQQQRQLQQPSTATVHTAGGSGSTAFFSELLRRLDLHPDGTPQTVEAYAAGAPAVPLYGASSRMSWRVMCSSVESVATEASTSAGAVASSSNGASSTSSSPLGGGNDEGSSIFCGPANGRGRAARGGLQRTAAAAGNGSDVSAAPLSPTGSVVVGGMSANAQSSIAAVLLADDGGVDPQEAVAGAVPLEAPQGRGTVTAVAEAHTTGNGSTSTSNGSAGSPQPPAHNGEGPVANGNSKARANGRNGSDVSSSSTASVLSSPLLRPNPRGSRSSYDSWDDGDLSGVPTAGPTSPTPPHLGRPPRQAAEALQARPTRASAAEQQALQQPPSRGAASSGSDTEQGDEADADPGVVYDQAFLDLERQPFRYVPMQLVATGRYSLRDLDGSLLQGGLAVPRVGPLTISNNARAFTASEVLLSDYSTPAEDWLAVRLEYITDRASYDEVTLQLFNISRVRRNRSRNSLMFVNGKPVGVGDPGVMLQPGDEVWFGNRHFAFRVEAISEPPSAVDDALQRYALPGRVSAASSRGGEAAEQPQPQPAAPSGLHAAAPAPPAAAAPAATGAALPPNLSMPQLAAMVRRDPARAEQLLAALTPSHPGDAGLWLLWAQKAAREVGPEGQTKARRLFRAAAAAASAAGAAGELPAVPDALQSAARKASGSAWEQQQQQGQAATQQQQQQGAPGGLPLEAASGGRHNWLLVQALSNWAKFEWKLRYYGSARHLFRSAVNEAARHPGGIAGGGGAAILHYWATQEFEALNVRNARIIVAEALRKCPEDAGLYVLAGGIELEGGNLDMAKAFCAKAYELDRTDKQLFLVWPRVEAALGDRLKARLLYERGLSVHPKNTKILNQLARLEAEEGAYNDARRLFDRALAIDPLSPGPGVANRCAWAAMESDLGNTPLARQLLEDGLRAHPRSAPLLVTLAKVERLEGRFPRAQQLLRIAQSSAGAFNEAVIMERAQVLRALGEREMATNLVRHTRAVAKLNTMKRQGYWGSEAWRAYVEDTRTPEQRAVVAAARARKQELGWYPATPGGKPQPVAQAGDGRRQSSAAAQQYALMQAVRRQRDETWQSIDRAAAAAMAARDGLTAGDQQQQAPAEDEEAAQQRLEQEEETWAQQGPLQAQQQPEGGADDGDDTLVGGAASSHQRQQQPQPRQLFAGSRRAGAGSSSENGDEDLDEEEEGVPGIPTLDRVRRDPDPEDDLEPAPGEGDEGDEYIAGGAVLQGASAARRRQQEATGG